MAVNIKPEHSHEIVKYNNKSKEMAKSSAFKLPCIFNKENIIEK